jgi:hypothetical protein
MMGPARFTLGVMNQMARKKEYPCSYAVHGEYFTPDRNLPEKEQRRETKQRIAELYNECYDMDLEDRGVGEHVSQALKEFVGTKRPKNHWIHKPVNKMYSFYAGKVFTFEI